MPLETLKVHELRKVADEYGVDVTEAKNKAEIIAILAEEGVTNDLIDGLSQLKKEDLPPAPKFKGAEEKEDGDRTIVKMERDNRSYETHGYVFTREDPFAVMSMANALRIIENERGFRFATPEEAKEYYS